MRSGELGGLYDPGQVVVREGDTGNTMFVIQTGRVEVVSNRNGSEIRLAVLGEGDFFGEMALFERKTRAATVRAIERARILRIDKRTFLRRVQKDPSLAFNLVKTMSARLRRLDEELAHATARLERMEGERAD